MTRAGPWVLALVCWFATSAGVQLLHPEVLLSFPGWWPAQILSLVTQLTALAGTVWLLRGHSALVQWLALLAWWAFPWQGAPQWLRVTPSETLWQLAWVFWLICLVRRRLSWAWLATLLVGLVQPTSLAGCLAGLALAGDGRQRLVAGALAGLAFMVGFQPASPEQLGWAGLALLAGLWRADPTTRIVAAYTLVSAAKGAPTGSALLAWVIAGRVAPPGWARPWLFLVGSWALAAAGETALNRRLIVPWQKTGGSLVQGLLPHSLSWWAEHVGPGYDFGSDDRAVCQWLLSQPPAVAVVCNAKGWDDPLLARLYHELSGGRVLTQPDPWGLAALKQNGQLIGTGVDWLVLRGGISAQGSVFGSGSRTVWNNSQPTLTAVSAGSVEVVSMAGPGGQLSVRVQAQGPLVLGEALPRLVLQPGLNVLRLPLHCGPLLSTSLNLSAQDIGRQLQQLVISCERASLPAHSVEVLVLRLHNRSPLTVNLEALAGLRARWAGQEWQPVVPVSSSWGAGQVGLLEMPVETFPLVSRQWLELAWEEPNGQLHQAARLRFDLWPQQQAERYLDLKPEQGLPGAGSR